MLNSTKVENGMLTGKKIFFYDIKRNPKIEKIKKTLIRLEAEIVEQFDGNGVHMVIIDSLKLERSQTNERKRRIITPLPFQSKIAHLHSKIRNHIPDKSPDLVHNQLNAVASTDSMMDSFLKHAKSKGAKIKSINDMWKFLNTHYKILIETEEPDDAVDIYPSLDKHHGIRQLDGSSVKVLDPFGGTRPLFRGNCRVERKWSERTSAQLTDAADSKKRASLGTSRKTRMLAIAGTGYCEMCLENYQDMERHLDGSSHKLFLAHDAHFEGIDNFISLGPDIDSFFTSRQGLWEAYRLSKQPSSQLPPNASQTTTKSLDTRDAPNVSNIDGKSESASDESSDDSDSSSDSSSNSQSTSTSSNNFIGHGNPCVSSTPINKAVMKPKFFSPDSASADDNQQSQISQHVTEIIDTLNSHLLNDIDDVASNSHNDIIADSSLSTYFPGTPLNFNLDPPMTARTTIRRVRGDKISPILSRRFAWCDKCKRNHVPIGDNDFRCRFGPNDYPGQVAVVEEIIDLNKELDHEETSNVCPEMNAELSGSEDTVDINSSRRGEKVDEIGTRQSIINITLQCDDWNLNGSGGGDCIDMDSSRCSEKVDEIKERESIATLTPQCIDFDVDLDCGENLVDSHLSKNSEKVDEIETRQFFPNKTLQCNDWNLNGSGRGGSIGRDSSGHNENVDELEAPQSIPIITPQYVDLDVDLNSSGNLSYSNSSKNSEKVDELGTIPIITPQCGDLNLGGSVGEDSVDRDSSILSEKIDEIKARESIPTITQQCSDHQLSNANHSDIDKSNDNNENHLSQQSEKDNDNSNRLSSDLSVRRICKTARRKRVPIGDSVVVDSPNSATKRLAAVNANRGIINSNRFFDSNLKETLRAMKACYDPNIFDPKITIQNVNLLPKKSTRKSESILRERNI